MEPTRDKEGYEDLFSEMSISLGRCFQDRRTLAEKAPSKSSVAKFNYLSPDKKKLRRTP